MLQAEAESPVGQVRGRIAGCVEASNFAAIPRLAELAQQLQKLIQEADQLDSKLVEIWTEFSGAHSS